MNGEGSTGQNAWECLADQRNRGVCESGAHNLFCFLFATFTYLFAASIILGGSEYPVYPINSCGSYPSNASYHDDVIERDMFRYPTTKIHFPGAFHISNRNYMQIRHHANRWYALM